MLIQIISAFPSFFFGFSLMLSRLLWSVTSVFFERGNCGVSNCSTVQHMQRGILKLLVLSHSSRALGSFWFYNSSSQFTSFLLIPIWILKVVYWPFPASAGIKGCFRIITRFVRYSACNLLTELQLVSWNSNFTTS